MIKTSSGCFFPLAFLLQKEVINDLNLAKIDIFFRKVSETVDFRVYAGEQKSHRQGRAILHPCLF